MTDIVCAGLMAWTHNKSASEYDLRAIERALFVLLKMTNEQQWKYTKNIERLNISEEIKMAKAQNVISIFETVAKNSTEFFPILVQNYLKKET